MNSDLWKKVFAVIVLLILVIIAAWFLVWKMTESDGRKEESAIIRETMRGSTLEKKKDLVGYAGVLAQSLDDDVQRSHEEYLQSNTGLATLGASHSTIQDDFSPAVRFVGLPRKAHYTSQGSESESRITQSETPEEIMDYRKFSSNSYAL